MYAYCKCINNSFGFREYFVQASTLSRVEPKVPFSLLSRITTAIQNYDPVISS